MLHCIIFTSLFRWHLLRQRALQEWLVGFMWQGFFFPPPSKKGHFSRVESVPAGSVPPTYLTTDVQDTVKKGNILANQDKLLRKRQYLWSIQTKQRAGLILGVQAVELSVLEGMRGEVAVFEPMLLGLKLKDWLRAWVHLKMHWNNPSKKLSLE